MAQQPLAGSYWQFTVPGVNGQPGGTFRVTPENAPKMISYFEDAIETLRAIDRRAKAAGYVPPPAGDPYSAWAVQEISRIASDEGGCHGAANHALQDVLRGIVDKIRVSMRGYGQAEDANAGVQPGTHQ